MILRTFVKSLSDAVARIADGFAEIDRDEVSDCPLCGARARPGHRYCDQHEAEFATRH